MGKWMSMRTEIGSFLLCLVLTWLSIGILGKIGEYTSDWKIPISGKTRWKLLLFDCAQSLEIVCGVQSEKGVCFVPLSVLGGALLMACVMDCRECMVYRYVWLFGGGAAGVLLAGMMVSREQGSVADMGIRLGGWLLFCMLQQWWFARLYGRADCHAFCVCALAFLALGMSFADYVYHMALTFLLLLVVQLVRKNITIRGKLRKPVPMLPYITAAFWGYLHYKVW